MTWKFLGPLTWFLLSGAISLLPSTALSACPEPPETDAGERKGIGRRDFPKTLRHELDLMGGVYASEIMGLSPVASVAYTFHINEDFAFEADFGWAYFSSKLAGPVESYTGYSFLPDHDARIYLGNLVWHPFHGKFMFFQSAVPHFDFFLLAGLGVTDSRTTIGLSYCAGLGVKIFLNDWLSLRIELRDHIHIQEVLSEQSLTNNLALSVGVGVWFPFFP